MKDPFDKSAKRGQRVVRFMAWIAVLSACWNATAQVEQAWVARYPDALASVVKVDRTGNVYVLGPSVTVKYDTNGNQLWAGPAAQAVDDQGNLFRAVVGHPTNARACGYGHCFGVSYFDFVTGKYDPNGSLLWEAFYDGQGNASDDSPSLVAVDAAGSVYVSGTSTAVNYQVLRNCDKDTGYCEYFLTSTVAASDFATVKYAADGTQIWAATYDSQRQDIPLAMAVDAAGNVYLTGQGYTTVKYAANGHQLWVAHYLNTNSCIGNPSSIAVDDAGNVYVAGFSCQDLGTNGGLFANYLTIKYDADGNQLWQTLPGGPKTFVDYTSPPILAVDGTGAVYIARINGFRTYKYDRNGNLLWVAQDTGWNTVLTLDSAGNLYTAGQSVFYSNPDYQISKFSASGALRWTAHFGGSADDLPAAIAVDNAGDVYVTGKVGRSDGGYDMATLKYVQPQSPPPFHPRLDSPAALPDGQFRFRLMGEAGRFYTIQASLDLVNWFAVTNFISATGTNTITDSGSTRSNQFHHTFYRAVTL